jgi:hypothetical protein
MKTCPGRDPRVRGVVAAPPFVQQADPSNEFADEVRMWVYEEDYEVRPYVRTTHVTVTPSRNRD